MRTLSVLLVLGLCGVVQAGNWKTVRLYNNRGQRVGGYTEYNRPGFPVERSYYGRGGATMGKTVGPQAPRNK